MTVNSLWSLDPQLAADTVPVGDLALSRVLLATTPIIPGSILVPRRPALVEIIDLDDKRTSTLIAEIARASRVRSSA